MTAALLNTPAAAEQLSVSVAWLNKLRVKGGGPRYLKLGARVLYDPADLAAWIEARKRGSTSEAETLR